jgi:DNA-binding NtrC family response regulator
LLDEIGEMPAPMQSKLLRVLEDGNVRPVGEDRERYIDVRVIAATNRDLEAELEESAFRADLFYRLETFALRIPPLSERGDDIELLAAHFIARFGVAAERRVRGISERALERVRAYPFPGNVRELSNAMERAVAFARGEQIDVEDLRNEFASTARPAPLHCPRVCRRRFFLCGKWNGVTLSLCWRKCTATSGKRPKFSALGAERCTATLARNDDQAACLKVHMCLFDTDKRRPGACLKPPIFPPDQQWRGFQQSGTAVAPARV